MKQDMYHDMRLVHVNVVQMQVFLMINNVGIKINEDVNVKKLTDRGRYDKGFICNTSNCKCECHKSFDVGEHLDYANCKFKKD